MDEVNPGTLLNPILYETSVYNWKRYNSYTSHKRNIMMT
jgi:hypothetical protein